MGISQRRARNPGTSTTGGVEAGVWEIVDVRELPEVEALMRQGAFQSARSLGSSAAKIGAPLLIYQPHHVPQMLFVPARSASAEEDAADQERLLHALLGRLREAGETPEEVALAVVQRDFLPLFLAEDEDIRAIAPVLQLLFQAGDGKQLMRVTVEHPELLSDSALKALEFLKSVPPECVERAHWHAFLGQYRDALGTLRGKIAAIAMPALFAAVQAAKQALGRYEASQRLDDLEHAARCAWTVASDANLAEATPSFQGDALHVAARALLASFARLGEANDLAAARQWLDRAGDLLKDDAAGEAKLLDSLAIGLAQRYQQSGDAAQLDEALRLARQAVALTPEAHPGRPGMLNTLATMLSYRFGRLGDSADLEAAIDAARQAVTLTPEGHPDRPVRLNNLANRLSARFDRLGDIADLEAAIDAARQAVAQLHAVVAVEPQLSRLAGQANRYTRTLVGLLWAAGRHSELAPAIEKGRGVRLRADITRSDTAPQGLNEEETARFRSLVRQERQLRAELEVMRAALANPQAIGEEDRLKAELGEKRKALFAVQTGRKALEDRDPNFDPPPPDFTQLRELAERSGDAIVYLYPVSQDRGTLWQIVHAGSGREPDPTDQQMAADFTPKRLNALLANDPADQDGTPGEPPGWLSAYLRWLKTLHNDAGLEMRMAATETWQVSMDHVLTVLGRELLSPVAERLRALNARRVVLIPGGQLAFLPLHAAKIEGETTFGDGFEVRYAASATLLKRAHEQLPKTLTASPRLTAIANPDRSLPFTDGQVRSVAALFPEGTPKLAFGTKARKDWLIKHAPDADYLELSTHASFNLAQPVHSAFQLAYEDGYYKKSLREVVKRNTAGEHRYERLTLGDIWSGALALKPGCMVCANACETGLMDLTPDALEEQLGFPTAFLSAGASTVMASFWAVSDFSTWLLITNVYQRMLRRGENASLALQQASQDLRTITSDQVIARLDAELPAIEAIRNEADIAQDDEAYIAATSALGYLRAERKRLAQLPLSERPFAHPYHWAAFAVHGAVRVGPRSESE